MSSFVSSWLLLALLLTYCGELAAKKVHTIHAGHPRLPRDDGGAAHTARPAPSGFIGVHDPSGVVWEESSKAWYMFGTGGGFNSSVSSHVSTDGYSWSRGAQPFKVLPAWIHTFVPGNTGGFWAPDIVFLNGLWHLYYAVSTWAGPFSCVGVTTTASLGSANWTDSGMPVVCDVWWEGSTTLDAIDPHVFVDPRTGRTYLDYGSFRGGVYIVELSGHPVVSKRVGDPVNVQRHSGSSQDGAEASWVQVGPGGAFFLFANWGSCCAGIRSTYNVRVGISSNPLGPYIDKSGIDLRFNGGTQLLNASANQHGPGQIGFPSSGPIGSPGGDPSAPIVSYHYLDGNSDPPGAPTLGQALLVWDKDGWPVISDRM
jgi:arabinan endo-1,5-alpha-L-arabinosidase